MPVVVDFNLSRGEDGFFVVSLQTPQPVGGWSLLFQTTIRFGGVSGIITKSCASGFNGVSGITVTNSGTGVWTIKIGAGDTSGQNYGAQAFVFQRVDSGFTVPLTEGYVNLGP